MVGRANKQAGLGLRAPTPKVSGPSRNGSPGRYVGFPSSARLPLRLRLGFGVASPTPAGEQTARKEKV